MLLYTLATARDSAVDAFAEAYSGSGAQVDKVHIRLHQRNRRKCILTITGMFKSTSHYLGYEL